MSTVKKQKGGTKKTPSSTTERIHDSIALAIEKNDKIQENLWRAVLKRVEGKKNEKN